MKIKEDHRLYHDDDTPYPFVESPNTDAGLKPEYLMMHYTAGSTAQGAIQWLTNPQVNNPDKRVSAHLVISRQGEITQLVPFNRIAWHAGFSYWERKRSMNRFSIGIELDNDGILTRSEDRWKSKAGAVYNEPQVMVATHWKLFKESGWVIYPEAQLQATLEVAQLLKDRYKLVDVIGHEDVHLAKIDPGPAFPMEWLREQLFGRKEALIEAYESKRTARVYQDVDGTQPRLPPRMAVSPLAAGTPVRVLKTVNSVKLQKIQTPAKKMKKGKGGKKMEEIKNKAKAKKTGQKKIVKQEDNWSLVRVLSPIDGVENVQGWVKSAVIQDKEISAETEIFKDIGIVPDPEPPLHGIKSLPAGTPIRILDVQGAMALVGTLTSLPRYRYLQGWVYMSDIQRLQDG